MPNPRLDEIDPDRRRTRIHVDIETPDREIALEDQWYYPRDRTDRIRKDDDTLLDAHVTQYS